MTGAEQKGPHLRILTTISPPSASLVNPAERELPLFLSEYQEITPYINENGRKTTQRELPDA